MDAGVAVSRDILGRVVAQPDAVEGAVLEALSAEAAIGDELARKRDVFDAGRIDEHGDRAGCARARRSHGNRCDLELDQRAKARARAAGRCLGKLIAIEANGGGVGVGASRRDTGGCDSPGGDRADGQNRAALNSDGVVDGKARAALKDHVNGIDGHGGGQHDAGHRDPGRRAERTAVGRLEVARSSRGDRDGCDAANGSVIGSRSGCLHAGRDQVEDFTKRRAWIKLVLGPREDRPKIGPRRIVSRLEARADSS